MRPPYPGRGTIRCFPSGHSLNRRAKGPAPLGDTAIRLAYDPAVFEWRFLDETGAESGRSHSFDDRGAAEAWMGESWAELLAKNVEEVALHEVDGRRLYRMSLRPE